MKNVILLVLVLIITGCSDVSNEVKSKYTGSDDYLNKDGQRSYIIKFHENGIDFKEFYGETKNYQTRLQKIIAYKSAENKLQNVVASKAEEIGLEKTNIINYYTFSFLGLSAKLTKAQVLKFMESELVDRIYEDKTIPLPEFKVKRIISSQRTQKVTCAIEEAGGFADSKNPNRFAWVIDTGIDKLHEDLNVDLTYGALLNGNTTYDDNIPWIVGHGTHIAGLIGAKNNEVGVVGVSAGAIIVPIKMFNVGGAPISEALLALQHVFIHSMPTDVVNCSWGKLFLDPAPAICSENSVFKSAFAHLKNVGVNVICAAGNHFQSSSTLYEPCCINDSNVFTVTSMTCDHQFVTSANIGIPPIDYIAVGDEVLSTFPNNSYAIGSGTSVATPIVTGILHLTNLPPISLSNVPYSNSTSQTGQTLYPIARWR